MLPPSGNLIICLPLPLAILLEYSLFLPLLSDIFASFIVSNSVCFIIKLVAYTNRLYVPGSNRLHIIYLSQLLFPFPALPNIQHCSLPNKCMFN